MATTLKVLSSGRAVGAGRSVTKNPPGCSPGSHPQSPMPQGEQGSPKLPPDIV